MYILRNIQNPESIQSISVDAIPKYIVSLDIKNDIRYKFLQTFYFDILSSLLYIPTTFSKKKIAPKKKKKPNKRIKRLIGASAID